MVSTLSRWYAQVEKLTRLDLSWCLCARMSAHLDFHKSRLLDILTSWSSDVLQTCLVRFSETDQCPEGDDRRSVKGVIRCQAIQGAIRGLDYLRLILTTPIVGTIQGSIKRNFNAKFFGAIRRLKRCMGFDGQHKMAPNVNEMCHIDWPSFS